MDHPNLIRQLKAIYYTLETFIDREEKDWDGVNKYIELFIGKDFDLNFLKTILVHTNSYKYHHAIRENRKKILIEFNSRMEAKGLVTVGI